MASEAFEEENRHGIGLISTPTQKQENLAQMSRWSLNSTPAWDFPPLAIANQYQDQQTNQVKRARYRLILVRGSDLAWLKRERLQEVKAGLAAEHKWIPVQNLPFPEVVLYAYAADRTPFPTYVCLPSGLYKARTGQIVAQAGPEQEILPLPGMYFFDGWRVHPTLPIPSNLPRTKEAPVRDITPATPSAQYGINSVARGRSERHPCDSRQESGGRWAKYKAGSGPRM